MPLSISDPGLITGTFAVLGTFIGALLTYWFARKLAHQHTRCEAGAHLRAAFASELAQLRMTRTATSIDIDDVLRQALPKHAAAIEEYRFFVKARASAVYQEAWQEYQTAIVAGTLVADFLGEADPNALFEQRIDAILRFTDL